LAGFKAIGHCFQSISGVREDVNRQMAKLHRRASLACADKVSARQAARLRHERAVARLPAADAAQIHVHETRICVVSNAAAVERESRIP